MGADRFRLLPRLQRLLGRGSPDLVPSLDPSGAQRVADAIGDMLDQRESAARRRAAAGILHSYAVLDYTGRARFFDLLARRFSLDEAGVTAAVEAFRSARGEDRGAALRELRRSLTPRYSTLLHAITGLPGGVKMLVDLRADLLSLQSADPALGLLDDELAGHLASLFDVGLLQLTRITWQDTSAAMLERLMAYEAVHEIDGWDDLKHRLDSDRRCYAFIHPAMPDEPLVFVEIALTQGLTGDLPRLLDTRAPKTDPDRADTAVFYSITNCQPGLTRVNLGNELIKQVVDELRRDLPHLGTYATLSPMPLFRRWAEKELAGGNLTSAERQSFGRDTSEVARILSRDHWSDDVGLVQQLRPGLLSLAARYTTTAEHGRALDPVGHFHLSNGASVERINWLANSAPYEMQRSFGLMVNYKYEAEHLEKNVEQYLASGTITASGHVRGLIL